MLLRATFRCEPTLFRSRPVSGSRYGSTNSVEAIAGAGHKLVRVDATGDVLAGVLAAGFRHCQALHLNAVDCLDYAQVPLGLGRRNGAISVATGHSSPSTLVY